MLYDAAVMGIYLILLLQCSNCTNTALLNVQYLYTPISVITYVWDLFIFNFCPPTSDIVVMYQNFHKNTWNWELAQLFVKPWLYLFRDYNWSEKRQDVVKALSEVTMH